jgi:hypothetical protein
VRQGETNSDQFLRLVVTTLINAQLRMQTAFQILTQKSSESRLGSFGQIISQTYELRKAWLINLVQQPCRLQGNREAIRYWYDFPEISKESSKDSLSEYLDGNGFVILWEGGRCLIAALIEGPFPFQLGFQSSSVQIVPSTAIAQGFLKTR